MISLFDIMNFFGVIAFTISGSEMAIDSDMDLFGVIFLGMITACGGGVMRDIVLGIFPPAIFQDYKDVLLSFLVACAVFILAYLSATIREKRAVTDSAVNIFDAVGLGIFTVTGTQIAIRMGHADNVLILLFAGVCTGVGGGLLRDIIARRTPIIFVRHIYAVASIAGCVFYLILLKMRVPVNTSMLLAAASIFVIRLISAEFRLDLPKVSHQKSGE